jgi:hypothetical protein
MKEKKIPEIGKNLSVLYLVLNKMSFMSKFFSGGGGASAAVLDKPLLQLSRNSTHSQLAAAMHYSIFHWRSHTDVRPSANIILLHDWLATNNSWTPLIGAMQKVPQPQTEMELMKQQPLSLFCPDLPNHGKSPFIIDQNSNSAFPLQEYTAALVSFAERVVPSGPIHLVGFGLGGSQLAILTAACMQNPQRIGSVSTIIGGKQNNNNNNTNKNIPLILHQSLDASDLSKSCGELAAVHQVDDFFAKGNPAMSDLMRFNTGTAHCGASRWEEGKNLKGTPSLQATSIRVRWNSNVPVLRSLPDFGTTLDEKAVAKLIAAKQQENPKFDLPNVTIIQDSSVDVKQDEIVKLVRSTISKDPSVIQLSNVKYFEGLSTNARGMTKEDAEQLVVPFLSLYEDHTDYAAQLQEMQKAQQ